MGKGPGHVFIVQGDLRRLACDAWLVPVGQEARPEPHWLQWPPGARPAPEFTPSQEWREGRSRTLQVEPWARGMSPPWLVHVGGTRDTRVGWFVEGVEEFFAKVARQLDGTQPRHGRERHLVALPVVGTAGGGAWERTGEVLRVLLPVLGRAAARYGFDVALVANAPDTFAAAQAERHRAGLGWPALGQELEAEASRLAERLHEGDLVLLVGAGASAAAGVPTLHRLLGILAEEAGIGGREAQALAGLDAVDQARVLEQRLEAQQQTGQRAGQQAGQGEGRPREPGDEGAPPVEGAPGEGSSVRPLVRAVVRHVDSEYPSLSHALLSGLPVGEVVTTNYDRLFELACQGIDRRVSVLPHAPDRDADLWLLKMHGSIERPQDIVLTREDYLRYDERRAALAGIVQALLMTRHMLFVGFSLQDDNFHRIVDAVRRALRPAGTQASEEPYGTALVLTHQPLLEELWRGELRWVAFQGEGGEGEQVQREAARRVEIFLDSLLSKARTTAPHLLADRFDGVLTEDERALRDGLRAFLSRMPEGARHTRAWREVERLVHRLGGDGETAHKHR